MMKKNKIQLGREGEKIAASYLRRNGYQIVEMNYRCRFGEIDIVARQKNTYVFVEVKTRKNSYFGRPAEAIDSFKKQHMLKVAQYYIQCHRLDGHDFRFDAIEIYFSPLKKIQVNHIQNIIF
ncbi:MAG TPA: YraN family protein [Clostridiales bacterium]|nr:YraN family protein [Clostridiales bacterium]